MKLVELTFDLWCERNPKISPTYRIYINDEIMTERDYIWYNDKEYLNENVPLRLPPGTYKLRVENITKKGTFIINNIRVNGKLIDEQEFTID